MLKQPLPERISFIRGFLQSKSWCWGKRLPLLGAPHPCGGSLWGLVAPLRCVSSSGRLREGKFALEIPAGAQAWGKGGAEGEGQGAGGCYLPRRGVSHLVPGLKLLKSHWET